MLEQLPNLQSLIVSQLPFFDHSALLSLRQSSKERSSSNDLPMFPLRLLIASHCGNTTAAGLAEAFLHWPSLVFLDLSGTIAARDQTVLSTFRFMTGLQVLKLRHIQLKDEDIEVLADAIGVRVRSLDIRYNRVTDTSIRTLLNKCVHTTRDIHSVQSRSALGVAEEDCQSGVPRHYSHLLNEFRSEDLDERFYRRLTRGVVDRLPSEDLPSTGLTHLYIANNFVTVEGIASLLRSQNLHLLDAGTTDTAKALGRPRARSSISQPFARAISLPGAEKLAPVLERYAHSNLTYLRLHYNVVSEIAIIKDDLVTPLGRPSNAVEIDAVETGRHEMDATGTPRYELDATAPIYELGDGTPTPRYELAGDAMHFSLSPAIGEAPIPPDYGEVHYSDVRRGSIFAPEVAEGQDSLPGHEISNDEDEPVVLSATGLGNMAQAMNGVSGPSQYEETASNDTPGKHSSTAELSIALIEEERRELRSHGPEKLQGLSPGALPALTTLVLTDVPSWDKDQHVANALKKFVRDCAKEHKLASLQASLEHPLLYVPGKPRSAHPQHRVRELFALQRLVLEIASPVPVLGAERPCTPQTPSSPRRKEQQDWSSTEDPDTTAFWSAQANDFSFFGDEECGLPATEPGMHFPMSALSEKMVLPIDSLQNGPLPTLQRLTKPDEDVNVVQELAQFRKEKKVAYDEAVRKGEKYADGYWPGEVTVVRNHGVKKGEREGVDWYGNSFEKGYMYR